MHEQTPRDAFCHTTYSARTPERIDIRIGEWNSELDTLLAAHGHGNWCFITAWNPGARLHPPHKNIQRQQQLEAELRQHWPLIFPGESVGDAGDWPAEASVLVLGIGRDAAIDIGRRYGQVAVVVGKMGTAAELAWCDAATGDDATDDNR